MQVSVIAVGKIKEDYLKAGIAEYCKRLIPYCRMHIIELADEKISSNPADAEITQIREVEGRRILQALPEDCLHIALDLKGKQLSSEQLADKLAEWALHGQSRLAFSIGGSYGLADAVTAGADFRLSFGPMTFPHQLMRLILLEQVYRACKINRGETYHK